MNICVVTPFDSANYGAFLQAYASKIFLERQGFEVSFLKWRDESERKKEFFRKPQGLKAKVRYYQRYGFLKRKYDVFSSAARLFQVIEEKQLRNGDTVIIGSDEVWNISAPRFQKECFYGLNMSEGIHKLAYAPSVSNSSVNDFENYPSQAEGLKDILLIGARDVETRNVYKHFTGIEANLVCDPTLLLTEDEWDFASVENKYGRYILVYSYDIPKSHRAMLKKVAKKKGCKLIAVGLYQSWCDINICCDPMMFNGMVKNAEAVYTTTFHGCIFTLLNHKKCLIRATSKKLNDLLERFELNNLVETDNIDADMMEKLLFSEREYDVFDKKLEMFRKESRELYSSKLGWKN